MKKVLQVFGLQLKRTQPETPLEPKGKEFIQTMKKGEDKGKRKTLTKKEDDIYQNQEEDDNENSLIDWDTDDLRSKIPVQTNNISTKDFTESPQPKKKK